jgi:hypothetical protein
MNRFVCFMTLSVLPLLAVAQDKEPEPFLQDEISFGIGAGFPAEKNPLNLPGEAKIPTSVGVNLGYRHYLERHVAIGARLYGYLNTLSGYTITDQTNGTTGTDFDIATLNITFEALLRFSTGGVRPYCMVMGGYSTGSLSNDILGQLPLRGVSGGGGLGVQIDVSQRIAVAVEGLASFGTASWEREPFSNSSGDKFNPSIFMALANVLFRFQ